MTGKSVKFELDNEDGVTMATIALSNSARISLTDITAATIGNLSEDSQWGDNSATDAGVSVLRPWEDNSDKPGMIPQNVVYEDKPPPTYKEHLKRRLESDENEGIQDATKRAKVQSTDQVKDSADFHTFTVPIQDSTQLNLHEMTQGSNIHIPGYNMVVLPNGSIQDYQQNYTSQNSKLDAGCHGNMLGTSLYSSLIDISTNNVTQNSSTKNIMPNVSSQNPMQSSPIQNMMQSSIKENLLQSSTSKNLIHILPLQTSMPSSSSQNSVQSSSTQNNMQISSTQDAVQTLSIQNSNINSITQNSTAKNSEQSVANQNLMLKYQTINTADISSTTEQPSSFNKTSNVNYFPWKNTLPLKENKICTNVISNDKVRQQTEVIESDNFVTCESLTSSNQGQYSIKHQPFQSVPTQSYYVSSIQPTPDYWQTSSILSQQKEEKQAPIPGIIQPQQGNTNTQHVQSTSPLYLQMSDILQTKTDKTEEYKPMQSSWQQMLSSLQTNDSQLSSSLNMKQEPATPVGKGQMVSSSYDSPGFDSRFTESLSNLLGSPPPDSPLSKYPILGDLQALLNRECKREIVPQSLFSVQSTNKNNTEKKPLNVFERERNLQERFTKLQSSHSEDVRQLSSMFRYQSALIETERFRTLHECQYPGSYKESVNHHYDNQLHKVMDRVERSVELLENSNKENKANKVPKMRPHLNKEAIRLMEHWYSQNLDHPYPTGTVIEMLAQAGNIGIEQVKKWFANKRNRNSNTRSLTEIAMQKRKLGQLSAHS